MTESSSQLTALQPTERVPPTPPLQGDEAALFARYHERLRRVTALNVGASADNIEEACAYAWSQLLMYQPRRSSVFAWLRQVARREAIRLETISRACPSLEHLEDEGRADSILAAAPVPAATSSSTAHQLVEALERLEQLPPRHRTVTFMRATGWQYTEIAQSLGISKIRVNQLLARADARLRELDQRGIVPRSARAALLRELEDDPPAYLVGAIGRPLRPTPKRGGEQLRLEWRRLALAIEDFRTAQAVTDPIHALGPRLEAPNSASERDRLEKQIAGYTRVRALGHGHQR